VCALLFNTTRKAFILVKQFRPGNHLLKRLRGFLCSDLDNNKSIIEEYSEHACIKEIKKLSLKASAVEY